MPSVTLINVTVGYGRKPPIFEQISVSLASRGGEGRVIAIVGRSGSGKSSLLRAILGLDAPRAGQITTEPKNAQFAFLSQDPIVLEHFSIRDNVYHFERIGATARRIKRTNVEQLSLKLGMRDLVESTQKVSQLSGGEKQRVALLRALSVEPDVLCLDEPCSGLDVSVKREFLIGLRTAVQARSILTLYVTHHADEALMIADEIFFIDRESNAPGQLWVGTVPSFLSKPPVIAIRRFFGGATLNTLRCTIVDGSIRVKGSRAELAHLNESISCSECLITFLPEAVEFSVDGVSVDILGRSEWFTFFEVSKSLPSATLIGPRMEKNLSAIRLNGEVAIFDTSGKWIQRAIAV